MSWCHFDDGRWGFWGKLLEVRVNSKFGLPESTLPLPVQFFASSHFTQHIRSSTGK